jgi:hypothetical protein
MRALFHEAASAGFQVVEIGDFASARIGARHRQVDRSAAL